MATVHLIHGFVGAGKTTYARRLERELGAVRFTHDEWMVRLYGPAPPEERFAEYADRVTELIWKVTDRLIELDRDVILDFGFWTRASRDEARARARVAGAEVRLYHVQCPEEVMRQRTLARSRHLPEGALWINEAAFEEFKERFEPLEEDEECFGTVTQQTD